MSLLNNAVDSIQVGVEDFDMEDDRRNASAIRNIFAGILLLYKEKLCRLSPDNDKELLIKKKIQPVINEQGELEFQGNGHNTVDVQMIKELFKSLKVNVEWKRFDEVNRLRNDLEHYYTAKSPDAIREIVSKSFLLIRDFTANELQENPVSLFGEGCWQSLLNVADVYAKEEAECKESLDKIDWKYGVVSEILSSLRCNSCHSSLVFAPYEDDVYPTINLTCRSCDNDFSFDDVVASCVKASLYGAYVSSVMDGGESPYDSCPECNETTYIHEESCCIKCEYTQEHTHCDDCGESLTLDEQYLEGRCSYCQHRWEKIMAE
ncbi:hypothetical protein IB288_22490 [Vibrio parahaemolyticus]|uniref:hypothetical protein n=1 Tax=Vibrio parahaemolyticus TaxID=670 RepID=UPI001D1633CF|nr:hypothetical protein [Vibrio parahaemolyticus]MCC3845727.1 hypothetical protein [Vibrio parahaemolyticus]